MATLSDIAKNELVEKLTCWIWIGILYIGFQVLGPVLIYYSIDSVCDGNGDGLHGHDINNKNNNNGTTDTCHNNDMMFGWGVFFTLISALSCLHIIFKSIACCCVHGGCITEPPPKERSSLYNI